MSWRTRDFFEAWPPLALPALGPVDAPAVFLLRLVMHDWKDEDCKRFALDPYLFPPFQMRAARRWTTDVVSNLEY